MTINELDVIRTKDGREGTVVHIYNIEGLPIAYEVEFENGKTETIEQNQIERIIWSLKDGKQDKWD